MKLCKGCVYLREHSVFGSRCTYYKREVETINKYTGEKEYKTVDVKNLEDMRSEKGPCGPEAKLYNNGSDRIFPAIITLLVFSAIITGIAKLIVLILK